MCSFGTYVRQGTRVYVQRWQPYGIGRRRRSTKGFIPVPARPPTRTLWNQTRLAFARTPANLSTHSLPGLRPVRIRIPFFAALHSPIDGLQLGSSGTIILPFVRTEVRFFIFFNFKILTVAKNMHVSILRRFFYHSERAARNVLIIRWWFFFLFP